MKEIECKIYGKVQGVFFRAFIKERADILGICGYVENMEDGTVEVVAQGEEEKLKELLELIKKGPTFARVDSVDMSWSDVLQDTFTDFTIEYGD